MIKEKAAVWLSFFWGIIYNNNMDSFLKTFQHLLVKNEDIKDSVSKDKSYESPVKAEYVVEPRQESDIQDILYFANKHNIPVTVRGAGSGKSGGAIPEANGIVILMTHFASIIDFDLDNACIVVQSAVIIDDIKRKVEEKGLWYPPDPSSSDCCTIGGNVAENAGGAAALKYGVTGDYVLGCEGFFGNGEPFKFGGKCVKDVAGYDIKRLLIGSEGTLAILTKIYLRLIPKPKFEESLWCTFETMEQGAMFLRTMMQSSIRFSAAEFMQRDCVDAVELMHNESYIFNQGQAVVLMRMDAYSEDDMQSMKTYIQSSLKAYENATLFSDNSTLFWKVRHSVSEALEKKYSHKESEDVTVPPAQIVTYLATLDSFDVKNIVFVAYGHLGDGNIHTNILNNGYSEDQWNKEKSIWIDKIMQLCIDLGGTLSGEHGIGLSKKRFMHLLFSSSEIKIMKDIKKRFDPNGILNPSKIFD